MFVLQRLCPWSILPQAIFAPKRNVSNFQVVLPPIILPQASSSQQTLCYMFKTFVKYLDSVPGPAWGGVGRDVYNTAKPTETLNHSCSLLGQPRVPGQRFFMNQAKCLIAFASFASNTPPHPTPTVGVDLQDGPPAIGIYFQMVSSTWDGLPRWHERDGIYVLGISTAGLYSPVAIADGKVFPR